MRRRPSPRRFGSVALPIVVAVGLVAAGLVGCADPERDARPPTSGPRPGASQEGPSGASEGPVGSPGTFVLVTVAELEAPIDAVALIDGTLLVAERAGRVVTVTPTGEVGPAILDLRGRTTTDGERGLLSIAVDAPEEQLVVSFTDRDGATTLEAHPIAPGRPVALGPARSLWRLAQPFANHNGGAIRFGPDGLLHLALGDGGGRDDPLDAGQDRTTPLGSIVRLDVGGNGPARVPVDNPFVGVPGADPAILATGLRNPWRFAFDVEGGHVWIADVGQGRREEINRVPIDELAGADFGWARLEGSLPFRGDPPVDHVLPVHEYDHGPGCSVTGGIVYRGRAIPELIGAYLFSDLCDGTVRALVDDGAGRLTALDLGVRGRQVVGFAPDADGEALVIDLAGRISRLVPG